MGHPCDVANSVLSRANHLSICFLKHGACAAES